MTKIRICGCGNNHDVIEAAMNMMKTIKFEYQKSPDCIFWHLGVVNAVNEMMTQVLGAVLVSQSVEMYGTDIDYERLNKICNNEAYEINQRVVLGFVDNNPLMGKLVELIKTHFKVPILAHVEESILRGPGPEAMTKAGIVRTDNLSSEMVEALKSVGAQEVFAETPPPGTKPN